MLTGVNDTLGGYPARVTPLNLGVNLAVKSLRWSSELGRGIPRSLTMEPSPPLKRVRVPHLRFDRKLSLVSG